MSNTTKLTSLGSTTTTRENQVSKGSSNFKSRVLALQDGSGDVDGIIANIEKEMPTAATISAYERRIANLEKSGGFSGQKTTANSILTRVRQANTDLAAINNDLTALENAKK